MMASQVMIWGKIRGVIMLIPKLRLGLCLEGRKLVQTFKEEKRIVKSGYCIYPSWTTGYLS
uniref:Uncharacterized protein n=1 Tax=Helianthus annuus TaxID=4232 RepID=A0A251SP84_HELAN